MTAKLPLPIRELRAMAEMKELSLYDISAGSGVPYSEACRVLKGRRTSPTHYEKVRSFIEKSPMPKEAKAA